MKKVAFIIQRRFTCESRNLRSFIMNAILPLVFVLVMIGMLQINYFPDPDPPVLVNLDAVSMLSEDDKFNSGRFQIPFARNGSLPTALNGAISDLYAYQEATSSLPVATDVTSSWADAGNYACFEAYLIEDTSGVCAEHSALPKSDFAPPLVADPAAGTRIGGIAFANSSTNSNIDITVFYNTSATRASVGLVTYIYDALINDDTQDMLKPKAFPLPARPKTPEEQEAEDILKNLVSYGIAPMFLVYGFLALPSQIVYDLVVERTTGLKHLHILMGVKPSEYWIANYVWDILTKVFFTCPLTLIPMAILSPELATWTIFFILVSFILSGTSFAYMFR
jgi:hypothetical protein